MNAHPASAAERHKYCICHIEDWVLAKWRTFKEGMVIKQSVSLVIVLMVILPGINIAETSPQKWELSAVLGIWNEKGPHWSESSFSIMAMGGYYPVKYLGAELSVAHFSDEGILSANLVLRLPISRHIIPFISPGLGICIYGGVHYNLGGGMFVRAAERMAIRSVYRNWGYEGNYGTESTFMGGLSYCF